MNKLYVLCKSCKKEIRVKSKATTRPELQTEKGDEFKVNCPNCGNVEKIHVNDIYAGTNYLLISIGIVIGVLVSVFLWIYYGVIGTLGMIIPILFWQEQMKSKSEFNSYMIRRK